ncbi:hypothetical protein PVAND_014734 [Polypedilum vanderplanki]|uniref:Endonuclease/exonuclease/phosphatase domain-containing protein n=1 Tax=Polypedilum vanderplanki TaxID=319348 RepID=A0A9J6BA18_POLVA|nr:hypothetical protein PVAND_014734 [Polypedilum vanderplanki]
MSEVIFETFRPKGGLPYACPSHGPKKFSFHRKDILPKRKVKPLTLVEEKKKIDSNRQKKYHVEISGNNPSSSLDLLKETLLEVKDYIDESKNILILCDFNHELNLGNQLESFMLGTLGTKLFSRRESTTNTRTIIDGVFGRIEDYNVEVFIYESYASHHKPLIIRVHELYYISFQNAMN